MSLRASLRPHEGGTRHVNVVEETKVNVKEWHISRLSKTSAKCCWAQRAVTKKKCIEKIVRVPIRPPRLPISEFGLAGLYQRGRNSYYAPTILTCA
jgi:hypothetical protein